MELEPHWVGLSPMRQLGATKLMLLKLNVPRDHLVILLNYLLFLIQNLESGLGVFISKKLPGDANTADPKKTLHSARV